MTYPSTKLNEQTLLTPPRKKLPKNYKLPNYLKGIWFLEMSKSSQRSFMIAQQEGEIRSKTTSKRDIETYAESSQNRNVGRASVAV